MSNDIKMLTFNVAGLRAMLKKKVYKNIGFLEFIDSYDIVCLQETKINEEMQFEGWFAYHNISTVKRGYSSVCILSKKEALSVDKDLDDGNEGRFVCCEFDNFYIISLYAPNAGTKLKRLEFKHDFSLKLYKKLHELLETGKEVIISGDFNSIQFKFDTYNFKAHYNKMAGCSEVEMKDFNELVDNVHFFNPFRIKHPKKLQFSYFSYTFASFENYKGLMIDYFICSKNISDNVKSVRYLEHITGSDHKPVEFII